MIRCVSNNHKIGFGRRINPAKIGLDHSMPKVNSRALIGTEPGQYLLVLEKKYHTDEIKGLENVLTRLKSKFDETPSDSDKAQKITNAIGIVKTKLVEAQDRFKSFMERDH